MVEGKFLSRQEDASPAAPGRINY